MKEWLNKVDELNRRDFMAASAKSLLGVGVAGTTMHSLAYAGDALVRKPTARNVLNGSIGWLWGTRHGRSTNYV